MPQKLKITLGIIAFIILCFVIDLLCIFNINRPLFAVQARKPYTYIGLLYDTYNCPEYSVPQIKTKGTKFSCAVDKINIGNVVEIKDTTKNIKDFSCDEALEEFYEDEQYEYFYNCIKGKYIIVKYKNGFEETVEDALKNGTITISDLDKYNIEYIKYKK